MPMKAAVVPTELPGVVEVHTLVARDDRGYFTESYSKQAWAEAGFEAGFVQDNLSHSRKGTLRGLHYQINPDAIGKLVRVLSGSVYDVAVDLRRGSPTFGGWVGRELSAENRIALWVPAGFGHGFLALEDDTLVLYKCTGFHTPGSERSLNYADPAIGIAWPIEATLLTQKDADAPMLADAEYNFDYTE